MLTYDSPLEDIRAFFSNDRFATDAGCYIAEVSDAYTRCELPITEKLMNANHGIMGGVFFTLGDFSMAVASNLDGYHSVTVACNIRYFAAAAPEATRLIAECRAERVGRTIGFYTVAISDDTGRKLCSFEATAHRRPVAAATEPKE